MHEVDNLFSQLLPIWIAILGDESYLNKCSIYAKLATLKISVSYVEYLYYLNILSFVTGVFWPYFFPPILFFYFYLLLLFTSITFVFIHLFLLLLALTLQAILPSYTKTI